MRIPSTTDAYFVLSDEYIVPSQAESHVVAFPFPQLIADMQGAINKQLDMATRYALSWTCREYLARYGDKDFDCFAFADKCAELGYRALLQYSFERGGPFDDKTCFVAAANGRVNILQLHVRLKQNNALNVVFKGINYVRFWAECAAKTGCRQVLSWLKVEQWTDYYTLDRIVDFAIEQRQTDLALEFYNQLNTIVPAQRAQHRHDVLLIAASWGNVEFVQRLLQNDSEDRQIDWARFLEESLQHGHGNASFVEWCFAQNLAPFNEGWKTTLTALGRTQVSFLQLAEKLGVEITVDEFDPADYCGQLPPIAVLKYLHERFNLPSGHFQAAYEFSGWESEEDMRWMEEHGYPVDNIEDVARFCRTEVLDRLWAARDSHIALDPDLFKKLLNNWCEGGSIDVRDPHRFRFKAMLKTLQWLQNHGCKFDSSMTLHCDDFIKLMSRTRPNFLRDYYDEIAALNMPLSTETQELLKNIKNKK